MSIEYFVEGKVTMQTDGDHISLSKGEISHNSTQNVNQKGAKSGVSYNSPKEVHPNDKPVNFKDVHLNIFFDGTQNNKTNTKSGKDHEKSNHDDDSYTNDLSNVARGFDAIDPKPENIYQEICYIEGIGTEDSMEDSVTLGVMLGHGDTGVDAKVTKGCIIGASSLKKYAEYDINILKVNVYGFSRGAAAARHFIHVATTPAKTSIGGTKEGNVEYEYIFPPYSSFKNGLLHVKKNHPLVTRYGYFGACLAYCGLDINKVVFNFVGLYDTVASYGPNHRGKEKSGKNVIENDTKDLGLDSIKNGKVYFVLQLAADDEYRDNFDLTNINSAGLYGLELTLPGVHSDIGGAYIDGAKEISVVYSKPFETPNSWMFAGEQIQVESEKFKQILVHEGWYKESQLEIKKFWQSDVDNKSFLDKAVLGMYLKGLVGTRDNISNAYDKIPLMMMFHFSSEKRFGIKYIDSKIDRKYLIVDPFMQKIDRYLTNYMNACIDVRNNYVGAFKAGDNPSVKAYIEDIKSISYLEFFEQNEEDLKMLRNKYLHWSAKTNKLGLDIKGQNHNPSVEGAIESKYRKRHIQDG